MSFAVFISFARPSGVDPARTLRAALSKLGLRAFVDQDDIEPGALWDAEIKTAQERAQVSVIVLTADSNDSRHQNSELQRALVLAGRSSATHRVLPWPVEGAPEPHRWPSGLSPGQAIRGEAEHVARRLFLLLKGAPTADARPSAAALQAAAAWLDARLPTPAARRLAIRAAALPLDESAGWATMLADLDLRSVEALIHAVGDGEDSTEAILMQVRASVGALPVWVPVDLRPEIDAAVADLKAERFAEGEAKLRRLLTQIDDDGPKLAHSLRARLIGALLLQGKADEAQALLPAVEPSVLEPVERERFARHLLVWERWAEAAAAAPGSVVIGQLIALLRDRSIPELLAPDAEVQLRAAELHVQVGRLNEAVGCAETAWGAPGLVKAGKQALAHVVLAALAMHWVGEGALPLRAPGRLLSLFAQWESEAGPWPTLVGLRSGVEQHPLWAPWGAQPAEVPEGGAWSPPLFRDLQRAEMQPGLEAIRAVAKQHPAAGLAQYALAYALLREGEHEAALAAAQRAHAALPGRGQRIRLAEALAALGRTEEASALIGDIQPRVSAWWRLFVGLAGTGAERQDRARGWTEAEPEQALAWATLAEAAYRVADSDEARRAAHRALALKQPFRLNSLKVFAHIALQKPADQPLSRALISRLEDSNEAEAEGLRMWLLLGDPDAPAKPVDWARLAQSGGVQQVDVDDVLRLILAKRAAAPAFDQGWAAGMLCHATWARLRGMPVGLAGVALRDGELRVPTPLPRIGPRATTHDRRCLIDQLGLEIIAAERLLDEVGAQIGALVTFGDVVEAAENAPVEANQQALERELRDIAALWAPVAAAPRSPSGPTLHGADAPAVRRWLRDWGHTVHGAIGAIAWSPPTAGVVIGAAVTTNQFN